MRRTTAVWLSRIWIVSSLLLAGWLLGHELVGAHPPPDTERGVAESPELGAPYEQKGRPLGELLRPDGTLDLSSGYQGVIDATGWRLTNRAHSAPRFVPESSPPDDGWSDAFALPGANNAVRALAVYSNSLYVGGEFTAIGKVAANAIARWDGVRWSPLVSGATNGLDGAVNALAVYSDSLVVGGDFTHAGGQPTNRVARWDGVAWSPLISGTMNGVNNSINALVVYSDSLYVGGLFTQAGGQEASRIARWDGVAWSPLISGTAHGVNNPVNALAVYSDSLYVGGNFTQAGGQGASRIARWDGVSWSPLISGTANGLNNTVIALGVYSDSLYVGGNFTEAGGQEANRIARWDGVSWSPLISGTTNGLNNTVIALGVYEDSLVVGGSFTQAGGQPTNRIVRWDSVGWSPLISGTANGVNNLVNALAVYSDSLYVGGSFDRAGGQPTNGIARWDEVRWSSLISDTTNGLKNGFVMALAMYSDSLYVGGSFNQVGGQPANFIARWDGVRWSPLISGTTNGLNNHVQALTVYSDSLYVGGLFNQAGGQPANFIARWDGVRWSPLISGTANGLNHVVNTLAVYSDSLYVGGLFDQAGGQLAHAIARWDGDTWSPLSSGSGNGVNNIVNALAVYSDSLYVGGIFQEAGGQPINNIARWDGVAWSPLISGSMDGLNGYVTALAVYHDALIAGGFFNEAGGQPARNIARWDGVAWSPLISGSMDGLNSIVSAMAAHNDSLYVGGTFTETGEQPANRIARWDGTTWSPLGSGVNGTVLALAPDLWGRLWVSGEFTLAGGKPSAHIARWSEADLHLSKSVAPGPHAVGEPLTYTLVVTNSGPSLASEVVLTDTLPPELLLASAGCSGTTTLVCALGDLSAGGIATITLVVTPTTAGTFTNTATVAAAAFDPDATNNTASALVIVDELPPQAEADLHLTKWVTPSGVYLGELLTYTLVVTNTGPDMAQDVQLTDTLPVGLLPTTSSPNCSGTTITVCDLGDLSAAEIATITLVVSPTTAGTFTNTATVAAATFDPEATNNTASALATVDELPPQDEADLHLTKWASPSSVYLGELLTYTLVVTNTGPDMAQDVQLTDTLPAGLLLASVNPGCSGITTTVCDLGDLSAAQVATITLVVTPTVRTVFTNTASVSATTRDPDLTSNSANAPALARSADITADERVAVADVQIIAAAWGLSVQDPAWDPLLDFVPNGQLDTADLIFVADRWLTSDPRPAHKPPPAP